ncbi:MAG: HEAT repeat domain-containing protein [Planctomycetes bacterium]|nr:HEAT repeat domain-containing protein [Planctomycetota bacterium]
MARAETAETERPRPRKGCCLVPLVCFVLGAAIVYVAFVLGRAYEQKGGGKLTLDELKAMLDDSNEEIRKAAVEKLKDLGVDTDKKIPALTESLKDTSEAVRAKAAEALGELGPKAKEAVPALKEALRDGAETVRKAAREALDRIQDELKTEAKSESAEKSEAKIEAPDAAKSE